MKKQNLPNCITIARMIGTICLLPPLSPAFYGLYTLTGFTDILDGWLARKMRSESDFGERLDSIADLLFHGMMLVKLLPSLRTILPLTLWRAVDAVAVIRLCAYGVTAWKYRRFVPLHTYLNKLAGGAVFLIPYVLRSPIAVRYCWAACSVAALASGEELLIHIRNKTYKRDGKTIWRK